MEVCVQGSFDERRTRPVVFIDQFCGAVAVGEAIILSHDYVVLYFGAFLCFYNLLCYLLRAMLCPPFFLGTTSILNVVLDIIFVVTFGWGIAGAAQATVISQAISGIGISIYVWVKEPVYRLHLFGKERVYITGESMREITRFSFAASIQQSVMNLGILMIQGLVNSFGVAVMAAFTAAVKIDSFAYMPAQEFGNAFSLFISQNHGAGKERSGITRL